MADIIAVAPANLLIDANNPRLPQPNAGQRDAQRALAQDQQKKILALARDIVANGLNPAELSIIIEASAGRYFVLEGNRRLVAIRALENPDMFDGALDAGVLGEIRKLAKQYAAAPIESVPCVLMKDRAAARHWIRLRHTGQNEGAGIVPWGSVEADRFRSRSGEIGIHTQALEFLQKQGQLKDLSRKVPASSFKRLLGTPEVRAKLGLGFENGQLQILADQQKVAKALAHVAKDLADGTTKTQDIYTKPQRLKYAKKIPKELVVTPTKKNGVGIASATGRAAVPKLRKPTRPARKRDVLIPSDCVFTATQARIRDIERELRSLSLEDHTNAVSVLLRVFVELSADEYIDKHPLSVNAHSKLRLKLEAIVVDLLARSKLTTQQAKPVRKAMQKGQYLEASIELLHDYIHNQNVFPAPGDLRAHWDSLQPFVLAMWSP